MTLQVDLVSIILDVTFKVLLKVVVASGGEVVRTIAEICLRVIHVVPRLMLLFVMCFKTAGTVKVGVSTRATSVVMFMF